MSKIKHQASRKVALNIFKLGLKDLRLDELMVSLCKTILVRLILRTLVNGSLISSRLWPEKYSLSNRSSRYKGDLTFGTQCKARMTTKMRRRQGVMSTLVLTYTTCSR